MKFTFQHLSKKTFLAPQKYINAATMKKHRTKKGRTCRSSLSSRFLPTILIDLNILVDRRNSLNGVVCRCLELKGNDFIFQCTREVR